MNSAQNTTRILIIEDDPEVRFIVSSFLSGKGYYVAEAPDGPQGISLAQSEKFHVVLLDLKMPQMDGMTVLEHLRKIDPELQVIITTGHGTIDNAVQAMKLGATDYLLKPFNLYELETRIHKAAEKKSLQFMLGLYEAGKAVFSTVKQEELVEIVMDLIWKTLKVGQASLLLMDEKNKLRIAASRNLQHEAAQEMHLLIGEQIALLPAHEKSNFILAENIEDHPRFKTLKGKTRSGSVIVCPLVSGNQLLGVLTLCRLKGDQAFSDFDLNCAVIFASQVSMAVQNSSLYHALERKVAEVASIQKNLVHAEKLASLGRFASGVAHEINNPLTSVMGFAHLILENKDSRDIERYAQTIYDQAKRCGKIVQDLLVFSRSGDNQEAGREWLEFKKVLDSVLESMSASLRSKKIDVDLKWPGDDLWVCGISAQLKILIENVLQNAEHALESKKGSKKITITAEFEMGKAVVKFLDNGCGVDPEIAEKIFDPFFTGKEIGKGAGLGLSLCHSIAQSHGGKISLADSPEGALFILEFPAVRQMPTAPEFQSINLTGKKSVLVVEDEVAIRDLFAHYLGYQFELTCVGNGEAALEILQRQDFDVIVCDHKMPKMSGQELFEKLKTFKPHLLKRFLFVSGFARCNDAFDAFIHGNGLKFLHKPFTKIELLNRLASLVEEEKRKVA